MGVKQIPDRKQEYDKRKVNVKNPTVGDKVYEISGSDWEFGVTFGITDDEKFANELLSKAKKSNPELVYFEIEKYEIIEVTEDKIIILIPGC